MWPCPKCQRKMGDALSVCATCGTKRDSAAAPQQCALRDVSLAEAASPRRRLSGVASSASAPAPAPTPPAPTPPPPAPAQPPPPPPTPPPPPPAPTQHAPPKPPAPPEKAPAWFCRKCYQKIPGSTAVCWNCGTWRIAPTVAKAVPEDSGPGLPAEAPPPAPGTAVWQCPKCGHQVPAWRPVCGNCQTVRRQLPTPSPSSGPPTAESDDSSAETEDLPCLRCGSTKVLPAIRVIDRDDGATMATQRLLVCHRDPDALLFTEPLYAELQATICGQCGHVEFWVNDADKLYAQYQMSLKRRASTT